MLVSVHIDGKHTYVSTFLGSSFKYHARDNSSVHGPEDFDPLQSLALSDLSEIDSSTMMRTAGPSLNSPPFPFPTDKRQAFNWLTTAYQLFWKMAPTKCEKSDWKLKIIEDLADKQKTFAASNVDYVFTRDVATLLVQDTDAISVAECPWGPGTGKNTGRQSVPVRSFFVATNGCHDK